MNTPAAGSQAGSPRTVRRDELPGLVGRPLGHSRWFLLDQDRIDRFAEVTEDTQWIHTDTERARRERTGTIAHGFLTLSMLSAMIASTWRLSGTREEFNYGCDKLRFVSPVPSGARVRLQCTLASIEERPNGLLVKTASTVEIEGADRPALVADWLGFYTF